MRFHLKINCEGHGPGNHEDFEWIRYKNRVMDLRPLCLGERFCITPMVEYLECPPVVIAWKSLEWAIFYPPCWNHSAAETIRWFNDQLGVEIERTGGSHTSAWFGFENQAETVFQSGYSNEYKFVWEMLEKIRCANCGRSPWDIRSWKSFRKLNKGCDGIAERIADEIGLIRDEWAYCIEREKQMGISRSRGLDARVMIDVCDDSCAEAIVGHIYSATQQVKKELLEWRQRRQVQAREERAIQVSRSLMGKAKKAIREGNQEALQSLREEFERVATLR